MKTNQQIISEVRARHLARVRKRRSNKDQGLIKSRRDFTSPNDDVGRLLKIIDKLRRQLV